MSEMKRLLAGISFTQNGPALILDDIHNVAASSRIVYPLREKTLTLRKLPIRHCIGRYDLRTFVSIPCPEGNLVTDNTVCIKCFRANGFNPSFYNVSRDELSPQQREYNQHEHNVYLAYFGGTTCKVGISHRERTMVRWREQGARAATVIKRCSDAYEARGVEHRISNEMKMAEALTSNTKRKYINERFDRIRAEQVIMSIYMSMKNRYMLDDNISISYLDSDYLSGCHLDSNIIDISKDENDYISGTFVGLIGDNIIVTQQRRQFMASLKPFISYETVLSTQVLPHRLVEAQMGLF